MDTLLRLIDNIRGKYIKQTLLRLEALNELTPEVRKIILDGFNDLVRQIKHELGYKDET